MDEFQKIAEGLVLYRIRTAWLELSKLFNAIAADHNGTMSMGLTLLTINNEHGTPVTRIAPRMGMEPNSLSRLLRSMQERGLIFKRKDEIDKRKVFICLTEDGRKMRDLALEVVMKMESAITKDIPPGKLRSFFDVMDFVPDAIESFREKIPD